MNRLVGAMLLAATVLLGSPATAAVVPLNLDNNGVVLTDDAQIVDVNISGGSGAWVVSVGNGLNFEQFFANFSGPVGIGDISISTAGWSLVTAGGGGGTAGNFGQFSIKLDGPVSGGTSSLQFEISAAGLFEPNSKGNTFAAKISSQQGGNAGGFVSSAGTSVSPVPLPAAVWLFISGLTGLVLVSHPSVWRRGIRRLFRSRQAATAA